MRIRVSDILELLAAGLPLAQIIEELPDLQEEEEERAALLYAARHFDHPIISA